MDAIRKRELLMSLKYCTVEACFSVPMLHLTTGNLPFLIGFAVKALHWGSTGVGFLAATPFLCLFIQPPILLWLRSRFTLRQIMIQGFVFNASPWMLLPLFPYVSPETRDVLFSMVVLTATLSNSICAVAWSAAVSDLVPMNIRGSYFGRRNVIFGAWSLAVTFSAGQLADTYANSLWIFGGIFMAASIARFIGLYYLCRMKFPRSVNEDKSKRESIASFAETLRDRNFVKLIAFTGTFGLFLYAGQPFYSVYVLRELGLSLGHLTLFTTLGTLGGLISLKTWGPLSDRFGNKPVLITTALIWLSIAAVSWLFSGPNRHVHLYGTYFITGFMFSGFELCQFNVMIKMVPNNNKAHYISVYLGLTRALWAMGPPLGAWILTHLPHDLGTWMGQPLTHYHVMIVGSLVACIMVLNLLHAVREPAERSARELVNLMANMREFNPLLAIESMAYYMFTPRGISKLANMSFRAFRRQTSAVTEVGEELMEEGLKTLKRPLFGSVPPKDKDKDKDRDQDEDKDEGSGGSGVR